MTSSTSQSSLSTVADTLGIESELFWDPLRLVLPGAWAGHIPFAFWIIKALRPRTFVELGTHSGNSYAAFCLAVERHGLSTRCFAVDTWQGDEHAGEYGEEVFQSLSRFNDAHFGRFSNLLRMTFDEARGYFAGGPEAGIDLLHIDGLHTYDAVKHDFETWRDALSDRAVVLFHDINVRERDFGVWRLWEELSSRYPAFAFDHSAGLGVLCVGADRAPLIEALVSLGATPASSVVRSVFSARGEALSRLTQNLELERHAANLKVEIGRISGEAQDAQAQLTDRIATLEAHAQRAGEALREAQAGATREADARRARQHDTDTAKQASKISQLESQLVAQRVEYDGKMRDLLQRELRERDQLAQSFTNSTSWRITAPLRTVVTRLRGRKVPVAAGSPARPGSAPGAGATAPLAAGDAKGAMRAGFKVRLNAFLTANGKLRFPNHASPDVSILLVLYNSAELTYACLASIAEALQCSEVSAELIILDNGSSDQTSQMLDRIDGATIIRSPDNLHFLRGANRAASEARGKYLLFLNNDALLMPGSLEAAIAACEASDDVGAVGGRIILPDGTLQEAGSVVWKNGACTGYGRGEVPDAPEFMYRRDVDYCSGAFLLTPRALFEELGAFDERYAPAYYEETDYCLRLWEAGRRIVFDPDVVILHYEFGSSSTSSQALQLQQRNHTTFRERHADWLTEQREVAPDRILWARAARSTAPRVLFIEDRVPHERLGAGYPRALEMIRAFEAAGAKLTLFPMFHHEESWSDIRCTVPGTVEVMRDYSAQNLSHFLLARAGYYDAIVICRPHNMEAFLGATQGGDAKWTGGAALVYDAESLFSERELIQRRLEGQDASDAEANKLIAAEIALTRPASMVISVSNAEKRHFEEHGTKHVDVIGYALDPRPTPQAFSQRRDFLFVGGIHEDRSPNADSLRWFASEIWPHIVAELGAQSRLKIVGHNRASSIFALQSDTIELVGSVDDLTPWYDAARVVIAPTRIAAGIPLKAQVAAAHGVPMVTTGLIAEQLGWTPGVELLAEDDPRAYAAACVRLYADEALWTALRERALEKIAADCSPQRFQQAVDDLTARIARHAHRDFN